MNAQTMYQGEEVQEDAATEADQDDEEDLVTEQVSVSEVRKFLRLGWWMKHCHGSEFSGALAVTR